MKKPPAIPTNIFMLVRLWPTYADCATEIGCEGKAHLPRDWARRGYIPSEFIKPLVDAAHARGWRFVTAELILTLIAKERSAA